MLILFVLLTACGTLEVGIEHTPTPDHATTATLIAASLPGRLICLALPALCQVNQRRLIGPAEVGGPLIYGLAWSPDGRTVALTTGADAKTIYSKDLWLVNVETGGYRQVLDDGGVPDYSPDGAWIALNIPYTGYQHGQLSLIAADGSGYRSLFDYLFSCVAKWLSGSLLIASLIRLSQTRESEWIGL